LHRNLNILALVFTTVLLVLTTTTAVHAHQCGDANTDGTVDISDAVFLISFIFSGGTAPQPLLAGDANHDEAVDISDAVYLISYIFGGGPWPVCPPSVTTAPISAITETSAQCGGTIASDGGATITARGVCWSMSPAPTVADSKTTDGAGTGSFTSSVAGLTASTPYFVRAYATNIAGTGYGDAQSFTSAAPPTTVTDIDGNVYQTVTIGTQVWMAENLKVTRYRNGDTIPNITSGTTWAGLSTGAYCNFNNSVSNVATYGRLYNWYAASDSRNIAPVGWHVPTDAEWKQLEAHLGISQAELDLTGYRGTNEGGKLKEAGTTHWFSPNTGATNQSGFTALPGALRDYTGTYYDLRYYASFYTCSPSTDSDAWSRHLNAEHAEIYRFNYHRRFGLSIRCVKD
jgi:uncharacterized protein (TIGR02145 family)